jgi:hypothetical protein
MSQIIIQTDAVNTHVRDYRISRQSIASAQIERQPDAIRLLNP